MIDWRFVRAVRPKHSAVAPAALRAFSLQDGGWWRAVWKGWEEGSGLGKGLKGGGGDRER